MFTLHVHNFFGGVLVLLSTSVLIIYLHLFAILNFSFLSVGRVIIFSSQKMQLFVFASGVLGSLIPGVRYQMPMQTAASFMKKITALPTARKLKFNVAIK